METAELPKIWKYRHVTRKRTGRAGLAVSDPRPVAGVVQVFVHWDDALSFPTYVELEDLEPGEIGLPGDVVVWDPANPETHGKQCREIFRSTI